YRLSDRSAVSGAGSVVIHTVLLATRQMSLQAKALHHGEHSRARQAARLAEAFGRLADRRQTGIADEAQQREFLVANRFQGTLTTHVVTTLYLVTTRVVNRGSG